MVYIAGQQNIILSMTISKKLFYGFNKINLDRLIAMAHFLLIIAVDSMSFLWWTWPRLFEGWITISTIRWMPQYVLAIYASDGVIRTVNN